MGVFIYCKGSDTVDLWKVLGFFACFNLKKASFKDPKQLRSETLMGLGDKKRQPLLQLLLL